MSRVLAGFPDGRADEGVGAGEPTLAGLRIARERGWTAPSARQAEPEPEAPATTGEPGAGEPGSSAQREPVTPADVEPGAKPGTPQAQPDAEKGATDE
jgi:NADH-quinone oxidoreductase subunit E